MHNSAVGEPRGRALIVLIGLLLGPVLLMWFLGRGRLGFVYLIATAVSVAACLWLLSTGVLHGLLRDGISASTAIQLIATVPLAVIGIVHAFVIRESSLARPWYSRWYGWLLVYCAFLLVAMLVRTFLLQPFNAPSGSMIPSLRVGDYFLVNKRAYGYGPYSAPFGIGPIIWDARTVRANRPIPDRGDVAVFRLPSNPEIDYVKRVIGLPGDRIQLRDGHLFLNGVAVQTGPAGDFLDKDFNGNARRTTRLKETLPSGRSYFVLDARQTSFSDQTQEFVVPEGHFFVLGDNRDNSTDSRFQRDVGFIPLENLIGKASLIFGSQHPERILTWVE